MSSAGWKWWKQEFWIKAYTALPETIDPDKYVVCSYYVEPSEEIEGSAQVAGMEIAAEESIGTWTTVKTAEPLQYAAKVFKTEAQNGGHIVHIAYPLELFDIGSGLAHLLSDISGNLYGLSAIKNVRFLDFHLPPAYLKEFKGPKFGIEGVREIVGTKKERRPHLGTIIKPKVGLSPKETAQVAYEAASGGVDFIKDDETLTNQKFCPLLDRLTAVMEKLDQVKEETGRTVMYALNITSDLNRLFDYADKAIANGANCIMVDFLCIGLSALRALAEDPSVKVPIHVHRAMHAAMTRNPKHGIHMMVLAKLVRLAGGDQLHTGTAAGKMEKPSGKALEIKRINDFLRAEWSHIKPTMPVASGGVHPALVPYNIQYLGTDIVINAGGGIHGHPWGTKAGAKAMKAAFEASLKGLSLNEYAKQSPELKVALEYWGTQFLPAE
jgi:ribulose-bisphosphate carboxylase large chain